MGKTALVITLFVLLPAALAQAHHGPGDHNCSDFTVWATAQAFFISEATPKDDDPHRLDADNDGIACEGLPNAPQNPATATARALLTGQPGSATPTAATPPTGSLTSTPSASRTSTPPPSTPTASLTSTPSPSSLTSTTPTISQTPTSTPSITATRTVTLTMTRTLIPSGQLCIAYVYSHDLNTAMSYQALLGGAGIRLDLIHTSNLFSVSFDRYSSVIIGPETGNEKLWGDPALLQANHIMESDRAVLGLGWGGSSFLGAVDLDIGWSRGTTSLATSMLAVDLGHPFWLGPNPIPVPPDRIVQISAAETLSIAIDAPTPPAYLTLVGREPSNPDRYPLVGQYEKYWLWGFNGRPADNTGVGRQLFLNVVHNLPNAACTTSAASPTPLVLTVTPTATPTSTPTITLSPVGSTATPLPAVGGQGLRLHSGTGALSWTGGASQTGYRIARWSPGSGVTLLLPDTPLAASTTSYQDAPASRGSSACYVVFALGGAPASSSSVLARSDVLCFVEASSGGTMTPFELSLGQSALATLAWESTGGLSPDRVMVVPLDGSASHVETIGGSQTPFTYDTAGQPTCFQMQATVDGVIAGATNVVCGVPGASTLGPGGAHQSR